MHIYLVAVLIASIQIRIILKKWMPTWVFKILGFKWILYIQTQEDELKVRSKGAHG